VLNPQWHEARIFRPAPRSAIAQDIADAIRRRIVTGDLPVNSKLPSMQKLATWYGVSLPTMQAAVHVLRAIGLVRVMPGVGTFVVRPREHGAALNHAWLRASPSELGLIRFAVDSQLPAVLARSIRAAGPTLLPRNVADLPFWVMERSASRHSWPETFVKADVAFHRSIGAAVPGAEILAPLYQRLVDRLQPSLLAAADRQRDEGLSIMHVELAAAIRDGRPLSAARLARAVARRELAALQEALG
jgi:DNA-binding FadR family transcriptional regulator